MTVFALLNVNRPELVVPALNANFPGDFLQISANEWLVAGRGLTAKDVSDKLGITDGKSGSAIVFTTAGYFGLASNNIWEWITVKTAQV